jgi:hypothetical protein
MVMDGHQWEHAEPAPAIAFSIDGQTAVRARDPMRGSWMTVAEGFVERVSRGRLSLEDDVTLSYTLPAGVDLAPLAGSHVRLMLDDQGGPHGRAQTLTIAGTDRRTCLVACYGPAAGRAHTFGRTRVRAALSQRPGGPLVFGSDALQYVLQVGDAVRLRDGQRELLMRYVERTPFDYAAYVIAEARLWVEPSGVRLQAPPSQPALC